MPEFRYLFPASDQPPSGLTRPEPPEVEDFERGLVRAVPPWLQRITGAKFLGAIGSVVDAHVTRLLSSLQQRFPSADRPDALAAIGRERGLLRGPGESAETYAARLRGWMDAHRERGNAYSMLEQLGAYLDAVAPGVKEVVDYNGTRHTLQLDGTIARDRVLWGADGSGHWARLWVLIHLDASTIQAPLRDSSGAIVTDGNGNPTLATLSIFSLTEADREMFRAIPRQWTAAHIEKTTVVLLHPGAELWGYRAPTDPASDSPIGTWADTDPTPGQVWQPTDPVFIEVT